MSDELSRAFYDLKRHERLEKDDICCCDDGFIVRGDCF